MSTLAASANEHPLTPLERWYALIGLLFVFRALAPAYRNLASMAHVTFASDVAKGFDATDGNTYYQVESAILYAIAALIIWRHREAAMSLIWRNKPLLAFMVFAIISCTWSTEPMTSLRRSLALTGTSVFGLYLALRFSHREFLNLLAIATALTVLETAILVVILPDVAVHSDAPHTGAWRGFIGHKNDAGRLMVLAALAAFVVWRDKIGSVWWGLPSLLGAIAAIVLSDSKTSLIVFLELVVALPMLRMLRRSSLPPWLRIFIICLMAAAPLAFLVISTYDTGLELIGRDATLTGRTNIWANAFEVGMTQPWLGFGYKTFWLADNPVTWRISNAGHSHSSYLDIFVELGLVGFTLFVIATLVLIRRAYWRLAHSNDAIGLWFIMYLMMFLTFGLTSFAFPQHGTVEWVLYTVITLHLTPQPAPARAGWTSQRALAGSS